MKKKLNRLDELLHELQMDEYLNEDSLPKIGEARGLVNELVKNCSTPVVSNWLTIEECAKLYGKQVNCKRLTHDGNDWLEKTMDVDSSFLREMEKGSIKEAYYSL